MGESVRAHPTCAVAIANGAATEACITDLLFRLNLTCSSLDECIDASASVSTGARGTPEIAK
eukprot:4174740-Pyramimonas_sp.AAC.1